MPEVLWVLSSICSTHCLNEPFKKDMNVVQKKKKSCCPNSPSSCHYSFIQQKVMETKQGEKQNKETTLWREFGCRFFYPKVGKAHIQTSVLHFPYQSKMFVRYRKAKLWFTHCNQSEEMHYHFHFLLHKKWESHSLWCQWISSRMYRWCHQEMVKHHQAWRIHRYQRLQNQDWNQRTVLQQRQTVFRTIFTQTWRENSMKSKQM